MSYDLVAFEPGQAPRSADNIMEWYGNVMDEEEVDYDTYSPMTLSANLRAFYDALRREFPPLNGPDASVDEFSDRLTDYECHPAFIYMTFRWEAAEEARRKAIRLAAVHSVGLLDPQGETGAVFRPGGPFGWLRRLFGENPVPGR